LTFVLTNTITRITITDDEVEGVVILTGIG
jgi:hypothetical protein